MKTKGRFRVVDVGEFFEFVEFRFAVFVVGERRKYRSGFAGFSKASSGFEFSKDRVEVRSFEYFVFVFLA